MKRYTKFSKVTYKILKSEKEAPLALVPSQMSLYPEMEKAVIYIVNIVCLSNEILFQKTFDSRHNRTGGRKVILMNKLTSGNTFHLSFCSNRKEDISLLLRHLTE